MAEAPTNEIAIGRKMKLFATFSPWVLSRSPRTATMTPKTTVTAGTTAIHRTLLRIDCQNVLSEKIAR